MLRLEGEVWVKDPGDPSNLGPLTGIEETENLFGAPRQWLASTLDGIWYRQLGDAAKPNPWKRFDAPGFDALHVTELLRTHDGDIEELWILTYGDGLYRLRNDGITVWHAATGDLPTEAIYSARATYAANGERTLWIASRAGLLRFRNEKISVFESMEVVDTPIERALKRSLPIGLIVIDLDHFKIYNDQHGHLSGDVALRAVA